MSAEKVNFLYLCVADDFKLDFDQAFLICFLRTRFDTRKNARMNFLQFISRSSYIHGSTEFPVHSGNPIVFSVESFHARGSISSSPMGFIRLFDRTAIEHPAAGARVQKADTKLRREFN